MGLISELNYFGANCISYARNWSINLTTNIVTLTKYSWKYQFWNTYKSNKFMEIHLIIWAIPQELS